MEKEFVPYEQALALKQLGFYEECLMYWNDYGKQAVSRFQLLNRIDSWCINYIEAPTFSQAFRWFRDKYKTMVFKFDTTMYNEWYFTIVDFENDVILHSELSFLDYEEAELECLKKLIEIVKNNAL